MKFKDFIIKNKFKDFLIFEKKLNKEDWIDRKSVFPKLSIFENKIINLVLLSAPIKLDQKDSSIIFELFNID